MRRVVLLVVLFTFAIAALAAVPSLHVDESAMRAVYTADGVSVAVPITSNAAGTADIKVELLETDNEVVASGSSPAKLAGGTIHAAVPIQLQEKRKPADVYRLPLYRVRYTVSTSENARVAGVVALAAIAPDLFELRTAHAYNSAPGTKYQVRVQSLNPVTRATVSGVKVDATLSFESAPIQKLSAVSDSAGQALLTFLIPKTATDEGELKIEARKGKQDASTSFQVELNSRIHGFINSDKLLYQPGQPLHARAVFFDSAKKPIANQDVDFELEDPQSHTFLTAKTKTNSFGIGSVDWDLPESAMLGEYKLSAELGDGGSQSTLEASVRISRYDLPNFTVSARPDRSYYLPGQDANIDVAADYLFGKQLKRAKVRLIREEDGYWDSSKHEYVRQTAEEQTAALNDQGHASFAVSLENFHNQLREDQYKQFEDLRYVAYVTDVSSGRTEQRSFTVRVSRDPIHVYIFGDLANGDRARFYVSAYYPDGQPASCDVRISQKIGDVPHFLRTTRTNRYGLAKVTDLKLMADSELGNVQIPAQRHLLLEFRDKQGRSVSYEEEIYDASDALLEVTTAKSLYADGESIDVSLRGSHPSSRVYVDVFAGSELLYTASVRLHNGRATAVIPYLTKFTGEVSISASSFEPDIRNSYEQPVGRVSVLYPHPEKLRVRVKPGQNTYRPGDDVTALLSVSAPSGSGAASALGVTVVDKAVEERVRTDQDFGSGRYGFWDWAWWRTPVAAGGITRDDLDQLDLKQPLPDGMDLAAEIILYQSDSDVGAMRLDDSDDEPLSSVFQKQIEDELSALAAAMRGAEDIRWKSAVTLSQLSPSLKQKGIEIADLHDPWNTPYRADVSASGDYARLVLTSAGPDKRFDTPDDFDAKTYTWQYFAPYGQLISRAASDYFASTGKLMRDAAELREQVLKLGVDLNILRDPWGNPYEYSLPVNGIYAQVQVQSKGNPAETHRNSPQTVWVSSIDYFSEIRKSIDRDLASYVAAGHRFPREAAEFDEAMRIAKNRFPSYEDPWGTPYDVRVGTFSNYTDHDVMNYQPSSTDRTSRMVTQRLAQIEIWSLGADRKPHTADDVLLARYSQLIDIQTGEDLGPRPAPGVPLSGSAGAIEGIVTDSSGAVVPKVEVIAEPLDASGGKYSASTDSTGHYLIRNLPSGLYKVTCSSAGFRSATVTNVPVHSLSITAVNATLQVGGTAETVEVNAESAVLHTESASIAVTKSGFRAGSTEVKEKTFTPRLRQFFPETLYWAPSLLTDANGRAKLSFKLADNITTWKMSVVASTKNGEIGATDTEIKAFQPFFVDHEPPKVLTIGDRIDLPVTIRNYLPNQQQVNVEMKGAPWFELLRNGTQTVSVPSGDSANAIFPFRTVSAVKEGRQQVHAANRSTGDAIEKPITVHPDGLPTSSSVSRFIRDGAALKMVVPHNVIAGSLRGELKIYPNLLAHVVESVEASLERPYGCGEQTTSSTYPSVLYLQLTKTLHAERPADDKARRFALLGYQRLLNYREPDGGFSYWGPHSYGSESDVSLTAYVIRFLTDASDVVPEVDPALVPGAVQFLVTQQQKDGTWLPHYGHETESTTAYVANTLAAAERTVKDAKLKAAVHGALERSLERLSDPHNPMADPYALAQFALAEHWFGDQSKANDAIEKLRALATTEGGKTYFALETNTPFYGWGRAGRLESTGVAVLALRTIAPDKLQDLADSATGFLLTEKDQYGIWYSGQATVNVLTGLIAGIQGADLNSKPTFNVRVNEKLLDVLQNPSGPMYVDVTSLLHTGENLVSITESDSKLLASAQVVSRYYLPWEGLVPNSRNLTSPGKPDGLRLRVQFDHTEALSGNELRCSAEAERIGSRGYGMMIAEIGMPPGADVDRRSLDHMLQTSGWSISRYDVLPDRVLVYLWPHAGGVNFSFTFRVRFALDALTAPSVLYDYYNPEANVTLRPVRFTIH
jgi:hypothetical protein